jgi:hypothetical protein
MSVLQIALTSQETEEIIEIDLDNDLQSNAANICDILVSEKSPLTLFLKFAVRTALVYRLVGVSQTSIYGRF